MRDLDHQVYVLWTVGTIEVLTRIATPHYNIEFRFAVGCGYGRLHIYILTIRDEAFQCSEPG
jgi:hypothetical protein